MVGCKLVVNGISQTLRAGREHGEKLSQYFMLGRLPPSAQLGSQCRESQLTTGRRARTENDRTKQKMCHTYCLSRPHCKVCHTVVLETNSLLTRLPCWRTGEMTDVHRGGHKEPGSLIPRMLPTQLYSSEYAWR